MRPSSRDAAEGPSKHDGAARSPIRRFTPGRAGLAVATLLALASCTVNGHGPLSFKKDCRAAIDRASAPLNEVRAIGTIAPVAEDARLVDTLDECANADLWMNSADAVLLPRADEMSSSALWELICVLKPEASAGCRVTVTTQPSTTTS